MELLDKVKQFTHYTIKITEEELNTILIALNIVDDEAVDEDAKSQDYTPYRDVWDLWVELSKLKEEEE